MLSISVRFLLRAGLALGIVAAALIPSESAHGAPTVPAAPQVTGVVQDSSGTPLANAQVIVPQLNRVTTTNGQGRFAFDGLPTGTYHVAAILIGFAPGHGDVTVAPSAGAPAELSITMHRTAIQLSAVEVTASPLGGDPRSVTRATTELQGQALSRNLGATIAQTLSNEPGIAVRFNGPAASAPVIRGLQGERVLVLQDGDRAGDLSSAAPDHGISIDPLTAQRIEVVRGPASLLYGNNALGGVVNVISNDIPTQIPSHVEGFFASQAESGSPGATAAGGVTVPLGKSLAVIARGGGRHVDDYRQGGGTALENTYFRNYYGMGGLGFGGSNANGGIIYRGYRFNYGLPSAEGEDAHIEGHRDEIAGRADITTGSNAIGSIRLNGTGQWYGHDEISKTGEVNTSFNLKTQTLDALARTKFGIVTGAVGASGLFKQYASQGEEALTPAANSTGLGAFVYEEIPLGSSTNPEALVPRIQLGGRYDRYRIESKDSEIEKFGTGRTLDFNTFSGSVGLAVPLSASTSVAVSAARAFRAPSVEELFSNAFHGAAGTYDRGNPNLKQETNQGVDGVLRAQSRKVNAQLGAYYSRITNFISPNIVKDTVVDGEEPGTTISVPLNQFSQADATMKGLEGRIEGEVAPHVVLGMMGDLTRGEFKASGEPLPYIPPARLGGLARYDDSHWSLEAEARHAFEQNRVPPPVTEDDPSALATGAYNLVNLSAGYNLTVGDRVHSIVLRADNVLDEKYRDATSRIKTFALSPGRSFSLVYKLLF